MSRTSSNLFRTACMTVALVAGLAAHSTSSYAFSAEAREMCTSDAFKLCSSEIPNVSKITACMMAKRAQLSTGCRTVMDRDLAAAKSNKVAAQ